MTPENSFPVITWADVEAQHQRIAGTYGQLSAQTVVHTSKDRMISATVDSRGRLVSLKLHGTRYRTLSADELCERIVQAVRLAREEADRRMMAVVGQLLPMELEIDLSSEG
jgi:hypothetical protein